MTELTPVQKIINSHYLKLRDRIGKPYSNLYVVPLEQQTFETKLNNDDPITWTDGTEDLSYFPLTRAERSAQNKARRLVSLSLRL